MRQRSNFPPDLIVLDRDSDVPMHQQLYNTLRARILDRSLRAGFSMAPSRSLARQLRIARNTVIAAYEQLTAEGYIEARSGAGTWVAALPTTVRPRAALQRARLPPLSRRGETMVSQPRYWTTPGKLAFHPGYPEIDRFPFAMWARLLADAGRGSCRDLFGYHFMGGYPPLREAIAAYLGASRGVTCAPEQVIVVAGAQAALDLVARLLLDPGDVAWLENPGYAGARSALLGAGAVLHPLAVQPGGWDLGEPGRPAPRLIYVTPSCQMPRGIVMRMDERLELLAIAERRQSWIIEDDYDSEYRFRGRPIAAMQGIDPAGRVIYVGTFGKVMFPALRIGFLVVPAALAARVEGAVDATGQAVPLLLQHALAGFISNGAFAQHLRRMRRLYADRQRRFFELAGQHLGAWLRLDESEGGMQLVGRFTRRLDDRLVAARALVAGVDVEPFSASFCGPAEHGLRLGFAGFGEPQTLAGIARLRAVLLELERTQPRCAPGIGPVRKPELVLQRGPRSA